MGSLITNASAKTALRQLRNVQAGADQVRSQISTGLKVRNAQDNPAFFLVANTTRGDLAVLEGFLDNLTVAEGATKAAEAGLRQLNAITLQIADMIPVAQSGVAIAELEATFEDILDQARQVINASGFQGTNLLRDSGTQTTVIGLDRTGSRFQIETLDLTAADFLRDEFIPATIETGREFVLRASDFTANIEVAGNVWEPSITDPGFLEWVDRPGPDQIYTTPAQVIANSPRLDYTVKITNPGTYYVNVRGRGFSGTSDSVHIGVNGNVLTGTGGVDLPTGSVGWGTRATGGGRVSINIATPGLYTINIFGREDGARIEGVQFTDDPTEPGAGVPLPPVTAIGGSDLPFFTDPVEGETRREQAGLMELLELLNPEALRLAPESAMLVLDAARSKITRYQSQIGAYDRRIAAQREYLQTVTGGLREGVAALVEADLAEASSRLRAIQVQEQLAIDSLTIANGRSSVLLSLFQ